MVFTHRDFPEAGVQVPAGTVEEGETLDAAVLREVTEETGLPRSTLRIATYLGRRIWQAEPDSHDRHFFHLLLTADAPESWLHNESSASTGETFTFCFSWVRLDDPKLCLAGEQDALIWKLPR